MIAILPKFETRGLAWLCAVCVGFGNLAPAKADEAPAGSGPVIAATAARPTDERMGVRLRGIFAEIDSLQGLEVDVSEGVVTISGTVASAAVAQTALRLANRIEGVVTVEDKIERSLDIEGNLTPKLREYRESAVKLLRAAPLLLLAMLTAFVIALVGHWLAKWRGLWKRLSPNPFLAELIAQAARVAFIVLGLVIGLNLIGASTLVGTVLGGAGVLGLAVGFAVRDTMENYISSIMLSLRQPFRADDYVLIGSEAGIVVRLTSRATILMTPDGNHLRIPNSTVFKAVILNYTRNPERRLGFELGVDAEDDLLAAMNTATEALVALPFVLEDPKPKAIIETVGDSSIVLNFTAWINQLDTDFLTARSLAICAVKDALEGAGFTLPEPIYRLRFDSSPPGFEQDTRAVVRRPDDGKSRDRPSEPGRSEDETVDLSPDTHLLEKAQEDRLESGEDDLLDPARPVE